MTATLLKPVTRTGTHARASGSAGRDAPFYARLENEIVLVADYRPAVSERVRLQRGRFHTTLAAHPAATELVVLVWADDLTLIEDGRYQLIGAGAPVDGVDGTGALVADEGSFYTDTTAGALYVNSGGAASPVWQAQGGGSGGVNVDNGTDPPAAVTTLVAPGAVIADGTATLPLNIQRIGPFHVAYNDPNVGSDFAFLATITPGVLVLTTFMLVTDGWVNSGGSPASNSFYLSVGRITTADYTAANASAGFIGAEPEDVATGAPFGRKASVLAGLAGSGTDLEFQGYPDSGAFTAGAADIYAIIATPAS
jgi:hypothetical protein